MFLGPSDVTQRQSISENEERRGSSTCVRVCEKFIWLAVQSSDTSADRPPYVLQVTRYQSSASSLKYSEYFSLRNGSKTQQGSASGIPVSVPA